MDWSSSVTAESALSCAHCGKPAGLQCPKCVELKLSREGAAFCTQDCFKASWNSHKLLHLKSKPNSPSEQEGWLYCLKKGQNRSSNLPHFDWTGTLRPYPISKLRLVPDSIERPDWAIDGIPKIEPNSDLQNIVEIKTPEQIERMRETCRISREVLDAAARMIRPGVTTDEIDRVVYEATIAAGRPWCVDGDFNVVTHLVERTGAASSDGCMEDFSAFIQEAALVDVGDPDD